MSERERPSAPPAPFDEWERGILEVTFLDDGPDGQHSGGQEVLAWKETISNLCYIQVHHPTSVQGIPFHNLKGWAFAPHEDERPEQSKIVKPRRHTGARRNLDAGS